jgi:hypothetical protein
VSTETLFGATEFAGVFAKITQKDASIPKSIGAPSVFIFTSKGDTVYAGPNRQTGMSANDELKKLLISGIEKNGGLRRPTPPEKAALAKTLAADIRKARKLMSEKQLVAAAELVSSHLPEAKDESGDEQLAELVELTGLKFAKSKSEEQLYKVMTELAVKTPAMIIEALALGGTDKATVGAVKLAELNRGFGRFPAQGPIFENAWKQLEERSGIPKLREQAEMIDKARAAEREQDPAQAITAYRLVTTTFPDTQAAKLSQVRLAQLEAKKPGGPSRLWKSKSGKFSVTATLISYDGSVAKLKTKAGKVIEVPAAALSAKDQAFLETARKQE